MSRLICKFLNAEYIFTPLSFTKKISLLSSILKTDTLELSKMDKMTSWF